MPPGFVKDVPSVISAPISFVINPLSAKALHQNSWRTDTVIPLHKGGSHDDMSNYRLISILPVILKIFERDVHDQLLKYIEQNKVLSKTNCLQKEAFDRTGNFASCR